MFAFMPSPAALQKCLVSCPVSLVCCMSPDSSCRQFIMLSIWYQRWLLGNSPQQHQHMQCLQAREGRLQAESLHCVKVTQKTIPRDSRTIGPCSSAHDPHKIIFLTRAAYKNSSSLPQAQSAFTGQQWTIWTFGEKKQWAILRKTSTLPRDNAKYWCLLLVSKMIYPANVF